MSRLVLDSGILLASVLVDEPLTRQAKAALSAWEKASVSFLAPRLFRYEAAAVLRRSVYQKRIDGEQGRSLLKDLLTYPIDFVDDDALLLSAYDIATRLHLPRAYDSQYLALAERLACDFWTADETLYNSIHSQFGHIRWLGQRADLSG